MTGHHITLFDVIERALPEQLPSAGALFMFFCRVKHIGQADPSANGINQSVVHDISSNFRTSNTIFTSMNTTLGNTRYFLLNIANL